MKRRRVFAADGRPIVFVGDRVYTQGPWWVVVSPRPKDCRGAVRLPYSHPWAAEVPATFDHDGATVVLHRQTDDTGRSWVLWDDPRGSTTDAVALTRALFDRTLEANES